jgi:hypothetical protein
LRFQPMLCVLQFLDLAVSLPKFFLEPINAHDEGSGVAGIAFRNVGRRGGLVVENVELCVSRRGERQGGG